ncbi:helix-turn-helix transcriptional regulator [Leisingera sp. ANG59]|uniref:helix-turn-helix transcriptional regulator n=1 Tax=Leisingera sp. ANG59 TaxID=2675221 RepID=UPI0015734E12|nr:helix-turn-helix domain-containing protein [Leisingera sp. ANG59]
MPSHLAQNLGTLTSYGKSVADICRRANLNRTQFNRYLAGQSQPSLQTLRRICDFFGVDEHEIFMAPDAFRELVRLRPPLLTARDPATSFAQRLFLNQSKPAAQTGYYQAYLTDPADPSNVYIHLVKLSQSGRGTAVKIIARYPRDQINLPKRLKFEGIATQQAGRLFCVIQESKMRKSTSCIVLSLGDFDNATTLDGLILGTEPETGNEITTYQTIWRYLGKAPDLRAAIKRCGVSPASGKSTDLAN